MNKIMLLSQGKNGAYPAIQDWPWEELPNKYARWPDSLDTADYYAYNGFVILTVEQVDGVDTVTKYEPNVEAWEAWKASLPPDPPEPAEPEPSGDPTYDEMAAAIKEGVDGV